MADNRNRLPVIREKTDFILNKDCITFHQHNKKDLLEKIYNSSGIFGTDTDMYCKIIKKVCLQILPKFCKSILIDERNTDGLIKDAFDEIINNTVFSEFEEMMEDVTSICDEYMVKKIRDKLPPSPSAKDLEKLKSFIESDFDKLNASVLPDSYISIKEIFYKKYNSWYSNYIDTKGKPSKIRPHTKSSDLVENYEKTMKLNAYANLPLYEREQIILGQIIPKNIDLYIDACSERLCVELNDGSFVPCVKLNDGSFVPCVKLKDRHENAPSDSKPGSILSWVNTKSCNSKANVPDTYYKITVSKDLFEAFTEDYCFRPNICKITNTEPLFRQEGENYIFNVETSSSDQDGQAIKNYFLSLILRKGLADIALEIEEIYVNE